MFKSILEFFSSEKKEIYILTSLSTFTGGARFQNEKNWTCGQRFLAYVDCKTNKVHNTEGRIIWETEDNTKHPYHFKPKTIYKVEVKHTDQGDVLAFPLVEVTDRVLRNKQLQSLADELLIIDGVFNFEFDKKEKSAEGEINWLGEEVTVYFYDVPNINSAKQTLAHLKKMVRDIFTWDKNLRTYTAEQTLETVNDWLINYSEHSKITKQTLENNQIISEIIIYPNGDFLIDYYLKVYQYMIYVEGNVNGELKKAYLEE